MLLHRTKQESVLHQRDISVAADLLKNFTSNENPMISAAHSQQSPHVVCQPVVYSIGPLGSWDAHPEATADDFLVRKCLRDGLATLFGNFVIGVQEPDDIMTGDTDSGVHLSGSTPLSTDEVIAEFASQLRRLVIAATVDDNQLCIWGSGAQMSQERSNLRRLVQDRYDYRNRHILPF